MSFWCPTNTQILNVPWSPAGVTSFATSTRDSEAKKKNIYINKVVGVQLKNTKKNIAGSGVAQLDCCLKYYLRVA